MSLPRYPSYKDSGVEWLGEVPQHWEVLPLSRIASEANCIFIDGDWIESKDLSEDGIRYLTSGNVGEGFYKEQGLGFISEDTFGELNCTEVVPGDVLISRLNLPIGRACIVPDLSCRIVTCVDNVIVRPNPRIDRKFLIYAMSSKAHFANMENLARGTTMQRISRSALGQVRFPFPPINEQAQIVPFLDREITRVDDLVANQRRLMELLKEKCQSVTSHAVTKGLNPHAPMKLSDVEWLGDVPEHWKIERGRHLFHKLDLLPETEDGVVTAFRDGQVTLRENRRTDGFTFAVLEVGYQRVRTGDLVIHGMDAFAGAIGVSESTGKCTPEYSVMTPAKTGINNSYFALVLRLMAQRNFIFVICPSVRERAPRFRFEAFKDVQLPVPPIEEQQEIMSLIESMDSETKALTAEAQRAIDLLQERRAALISATVTGQIDVRSFAEGPAA